MNKNEEKNTIAPVRPTDFQLAEHRMRRFDTVINADLKDQVENPALWVNVAPKINIGDEIRIVADNLSWVAYAICLHSAGSQVKLKVLHGYELEDVEKLNQTGSMYIVKQRGVRKWCIQDVRTGEWIREEISTQAEALKEVNELDRIMSM